MIRFRRLFNLETENDRREFASIEKLFHAAFPSETDATRQIRAYLSGEKANFEPLLLLAEDRRGTVIGFTFTFYFPDIRIGYVQYIASDPDKPARGIGGALYEALREYLVQKSARALLLDVPPDEPDKISDPEQLAINRKRTKFYERYGALPIRNTLWDVEANPRNEGYLTMLLYDGLGRTAQPRRAEMRRAVRRILVTQYGYAADDPFVKRIINSFVDDPLPLRQRRRADESPRSPRAPTWIRPLKVVVAVRHEIHHLRERGYVERPVRMRAVMRGLEGLPIEVLPVHHHSEQPIKAVHDAQLVDFLSAVSRRLGPDQIVYPEVFPIRRPDRRPREIADRAGYFCADTFTPLTANSYIAARAAVDATITAAGLLQQGERLGYALVRPPGHHAERRIYGGFCYLNNAAIAANQLSATGKVALLDIDHHHGNGSQDIFYARNDVLTVSIHGDPRNSYPHFSGYADERGEGDGAGFNRNFPLPRGIEDDRYLEVLDDAIALIRRFAPRWLVISLGFDIMRGDPTGSFLVSTGGMRRIGERLGRLGLPTLIVQEGGYSAANLRSGSHAFFSGITSRIY